MRTEPDSTVAARAGPGGADATPSRSTRHHMFGALALTGAAALALWHLTTRSDISETVIGVVDIAALLTLAVGPHLRRARPTSLWAWVTLGSVLSVAAAIIDPYAPPGRLSLSDALFLGGYVCYWVWFVGVSRIVGRANAVPLLLDILAAAAAILLGLWTLPALSPNHPDLAAAVVWGIYPMLDGMGLVLVGHLAFRAGWRSPAWRWLFGAALMLFVTDSILVVAVVTHLDIVRDIGLAVSVFPYTILAVAGTSPTVADLTEEVVAPPGKDRFWRSAVVYFSVLPGVASLALPASGPLDLPVRAGLVGVLLALMHMRLLRTLHELSRAEAESRHRADHDPLTGLPTRAALLDELGRRLPRDHAMETSTGVLFLDCDQFKSVNDVWGHPAGDALLRSIATRLASEIREGDVVARHGGDEFVVVSRVRDTAEAEVLARRIQGVFTHPFEVLPGVSVPVTSSIGVAASPPSDPASPLELLERADVALYSAKSSGRSRYAVYDGHLEERTREHARLVHALRDAVAHDRIDIAFQPLYGGQGYGRLLGWESLARWHDPDLGPVPPDVFIAVAEDLGLIEPLGRQLLRKSCVALARLRTVPAYARTHVAVNVSALQLHRATFADVVVETLEELGLPRDAVFLEITESILISRTSPVHQAVDRLRSAGLRISIDDFGTGYSSITALLDLPVDCVKIDRSLVERITEDAGALEHLRAVVDFVTSLDIDLVIAEGIETPGQAAALAEMGCPMVQGYLFGRPAAPSSIVHPAGAAAMSVGATLSLDEREAGS